MSRAIYFLFFLFSININSQTTLNVPSEYATIQAAINAAQDGDTVLVEDGIYYLSTENWDGQCGNDGEDSGGIYFNSAL